MIASSGDYVQKQKFPPPINRSSKHKTSAWKLLYNTSLYMEQIVHLLNVCFLYGRSTDCNTKLIRYVMLSIMRHPLLVKSSFTTFNRHLYFALNYVSRHIYIYINDAQTLNIALLIDTFLHFAYLCSIPRYYKTYFTY